MGNTEVRRRGRSRVQRQFVLRRGVVSLLLLCHVELRCMAHSAPPPEVAGEKTLSDHRRGSNASYSCQRRLHRSRRSRGPRNVTGRRPGSIASMSSAMSS